MRTSSCSHLVILLLVALLVCPPPLLAAVIVVDGTCTLVDAITAANTDTATGDCPAGSGADEIRLSVDVTLTAVDNTLDGPNGLPSVTSQITIRSSVASPRTVERAVGSPYFRIFHIGSSGDLNLEKVVVSNAYSIFEEGGGLLNFGHLALVNTTVSGNSADMGGGIYNYYGATLSLANSTIYDNAAMSDGGGIFNWASTATLTNSTVSGNAAASDGAGIANVSGSVILVDSTVSGNWAIRGGGVFNSDSGTVTLTNGTLSGNLANYGGGIYSSDVNSSATLTNITVSTNQAYYGSGIYNWQATTTLTGSLVGNSPNGENCAGDPVNDGGDNLADDATCGTIPDTLTGLDSTLADNGGPTLTHALLAGSNAIDLAGDCGLSTDQRLAPRNDGNCDSGSFEFGASPDEIFSDGFESGDTSAWSGTVP